MILVLTDFHLLPLADAENVGKIVIGAIFVVGWMIVQIVTAAKAAAKKRELVASQQRRPQTTPPNRIAGPPPMPAMPAARFPAGSYDELRRRLLDAAQQTAPSAPAVPRSSRRRREAAVDPVAAATPFAATARDHVATGITAGAIGDAAMNRALGNAEAATARRQTGRPHRVAVLLRRETLGDLFLAAEILRPPVALRDGDDGAR